jgi:hypothetical protein
LQGRVFPLDGVDFLSEIGGKVMGYGRGKENACEDGELLLWKVKSECNSRTVIYLGLWPMDWVISCLFETKSSCVSQAGLEFLDSSGPPASVGTIAACHPTAPGLGIKE